MISHTYIHTITQDYAAAIILTSKFKQRGMKTMNKPTNSTSRQKLPPPRPKPQFSTDFVDREKYKLSQTETIQKKAALQSKHRQQAIEQLQQRRKKLEMGIIDDDTRKVYQTALTSKKIDLNPNNRRNLSQMIQYEKEKQRQVSKERGEEDAAQEYNSKQQESNNEEQFEKELKEAQAFIKKFERAKKMDKIERAVNILTEPQAKSSSMTKPSPNKAAKSRDKSREKRPVFQNSCINNNILKQSQTSLNISSNEEILSNIEDTIRFMEERLFSAGRIDKIKKQHQNQEQSVAVSRAQPLKTNYSELPYRCNQSLANTDQMSNHFYPQTLEISHLKVKEEGSDEDNDCLDTIRRMKEMIDIRESLEQAPCRRNMKENYDLGNKSKKSLEWFSTVQKQNAPPHHHADSDAEIDFSLTMNNSLQQSERQPPQKWTNFAANLQQSSEQEEYQRIKKSLFEEVNRLQLHSVPNINDSSQQSIHAKTHQKGYEMMDESSITNLRSLPTPSPITHKQHKKGNPQLQKLKNQINGTRSIVESIKVEPVSSSSKAEVIGMDFRGSFNIKKNVLQ